MKLQHSGILLRKGKYCRTHPDMVDGSGGVTPACRDYSDLHEKKGSTVLGVIPQGTVIGPLQQVVIVKIMGTCGTEIELPSTTRVGQLTWVMMCRGYTRCMDEVHVPMSYYNIPSKELITEKAVDTAEPCSKDWRQSCVEKTHATSSKSPETGCYTLKAQFPSKKRSGRLFMKIQEKTEHLPTAISKFVTMLLRHRDQEERDTDGAVHWDSFKVDETVWGPKWTRIIHSKIGLKRSMKEAIRKGSSTA